jgi:hypothetical protein
LVIKGRPPQTYVAAGLFCWNLCLVEEAGRQAGLVQPAAPLHFIHIS